MTIGLIWAQARGGVIGAGGGIPWHVPEDMAHFKRRTLGSTVVMGRNTWDSLPPSFRPLPERRNIVLTSRPDLGGGAEVATSPEAAFAMAHGDVWVIGGGQVYAAALPLAELVVVTDIDADIDGDVRAPRLGTAWAAEAADWQVSTKGLRYRIREFRRAPAIPS